MTPSVAEAGTATAAVNIRPEEEQTTVRGARLYRLTGLPEVGRTAVAGFMGMLLATALLILVISASNIAGLLLARASARRRELAVRLAVGAGRGRLVRQLLTETMMLFLAGGMAGLVLAIGLGKAISQVRLPLGLVVPDFTPDPRMLGFGLLVAGVTGLAFGVAPAWQASKPDLVPALKETGSSGTRRATRERGVFVSVQLAFAVVLLVTAGLFLRTLQKALATDPGFDSDNVVIATTSLGPHGYDEVRGRLFYTQLLDRIRAEPGVESAALSSSVQLGLASNTSDAKASGAGLTEGTSTNVTWNRADEGYLATLRGTLVAGRWFSSADGPGAPGVAVINETAAARLWPGRSPLGGRLVMMGGPGCCEVIGVVRDGKYATVQEEPVAYAFFAFSQQFTTQMTLHVRTRLSVAAMIGAIRRTVRALDRNVAVEEAMPLTQMTGISLLPQRFAATLVGSFGAIGLLLSCIGLYGVLAHDVTQRKRELGIRMALGARSAHVLRLVLRRVGVLVALGGLAGLGIAAMVTGFLRSFLYQVEPLDPATFAAVPMLLTIVAMLASYAPARRAVRINPQEALRAE
jgi:predicted permease